MENLENIKIDLCFQALGKNLPVDHGFALYSSISRILPEFHQDENSGLKLIRGRYVGNGFLDISPCSELVLRIQANRIKAYIKLAGKILQIMGCKLTTGVTKVQTILPLPQIYSPLVTTRNGEDQQRFVTEIEKQLKAFSSNANFTVLKRRTFRVHNKQVVGYSMIIGNLNDEESVKIQEEGLGGRRKMGCGFFEPMEERQVKEWEKYEIQTSSR